MHISVSILVEATHRIRPFAVDLFKALLFSLPIAEILLNKYEKLSRKVSTVHQHICNRGTNN